MNAETAIKIIDQVYGFDDETTTVGEAWEKMKSDLQAARAELEAAREQADELEKMNRHLSSFLEEAAHAAASGENPKKYLATSAPTVLRDRIKELWEALTALRRQIDGAAEITAEYFGDFVCWTPTFDEPTELKLNMQPGQTRTFRLLEVKP